jgi:2-haloacid dehalogenase
MSYTRRELACAGFKAMALATVSQAAVDTPMPIKAIAFDAFPILDARPIWATAEEVFPGKGAEFSNLWRTRQFEYAWLRTRSRRYADFHAVTEDALQLGQAPDAVGSSLSDLVAYCDHPDRLR